MKFLSLLACFALLTGCDDHPAAKAPKKLALPQGENSLDALLKKPIAPPPAPAHLAAEPASYSFPQQFAGATSHGQIRLTNSGGMRLTLGPVRIAGQAADFSIGGDCQPGQSLAPGAACTADIAFRPRRAGSSQAELVVDQGAAGPSLFLPLSGDAVAEVKPESPGTAEARESLTYASVRQSAALTIAAPEAESDEAPSSADYGDAGLPGVVSGYPVDRSRVLTADRYIPAVLENTLNSQLPGRAIAVVERPVFGEDGRMVLIPAGSRVIGQYRSVAKYGQARLDITWTRILRPDGVNINIESDAADVMGRAGLPGDLDTRFVEKYGSSLLTSVIGAAGEWALASSSTQVTSSLGSTTQVESGRTMAANRLGNDVDRLAQRIVEDNVDIRPVLTVPQGTRLVIIPGEDIWLRDPHHLQAVTPPRTARIGTKPLDGNRLLELLPSLVDTLAQNPAVQKAMPQTAQQIMQSALMQQLRTDPSLAAGAANTAGNTSGAAKP